MSQAVFDLIKEHDVKFIDLRFTDSKGKEQHVSIPHHQVNEDFFEDGKCLMVLQSKVGKALMNLTW